MKVYVVLETAFGSDELVPVALFRSKKNADFLADKLAGKSYVQEWEVFL